MGSPLYTVDAVPNYLGVFPATVMNWVKSKKITSVLTQSGHRKFRKEEIQRLQSENPVLSNNDQLHRRAMKKAKKTPHGINSPFRYPGGKFYARKLILDALTSHDSYCEMFCGGGSIFFAKPKVSRNLLNDLDPDLINCYLVIRDHVEELITALDGIPATKETHGFYKNEYKPQNALERALRWFYLNRTSYSGIMKMQNCYWGYGEKYSMRPENWPRHLRKVSEKLLGVEFTMHDFAELAARLTSETFVFVDPPYFNADQDKFYTCCFTKDDHVKLRDCLKEMSDRGIRFLLTYDNSPEIREMYDGWCKFDEKKWTYTISRTDDQKRNKKLADGHQGERSAGKEVFITNY
jgi:DNA adenine methylase